jgi:hypothetical protein
MRWRRICRHRWHPRRAAWWVRSRWGVPFFRACSLLMPTKTDPSVIENQALASVGSKPRPTMQAAA